MELLANDLSMHGQFRDQAAFRGALERLMALRDTAHRFGREVHCQRAFLAVEAQKGVPLPRTLGRLRESERRAVMQWLTRRGPFWDEVRRHGDDDLFECRDDVVTNTAIGEAAYRTLHGVPTGLVSVSPSNWCVAPVPVTWKDPPDGPDDRHVDLGNWWEADELERSLRASPRPVRSWDDLRQEATTRCGSLMMTDDCFTPLAGRPFVSSAADRILVLLDILDRLAGAFDVSGRRTREGHGIYQTYFTGSNALFSDSSDTEKRGFRKELTFRHPQAPGTPLFCSWHGKAADFRIHFSWPIRFGAPVYVVYVGLKITRR